MPITFSQLRAVFEADTSALDRAIGEIDRRLDGLGKNRPLAVGAALTAGLTVPILGIGAAALKAGLAMDEAFDRIRTATGATGASLAGLQESFRNVARDTPSAFGEISTAMVALAQRTGLTGTALEELTKQQLDLARITGGSVGESIRETTRLLGDWSIQMKDAAGASDFLFRVSQQTGVGLGRLRQLLVQYGAPLRQLGFSFQQASLLIAKFDKEGVNVELVLAALRRGLQQFAKAGVDPAATLQALITKIRDTGSAAEANSLGFKVFGARLGSDMVAAIREGRFNLDELIKKLSQSNDTIRGAAKETEDFGETWQRFQNRLTVGSAALGTPLINILNNVVTALEPAIRQLETFSRWFVELPQGTQTFALGLAGVAAAAGPVITGVAGIKTALETLSPKVAGMVKNLFNWRTGFLLAGAALVYFTVTAIQKLGGLDAFFKKVSSGFMSGIKMIADFAQAAGKLSLPQLGQAAKDLWNNWGSYLKTGWGVLTGQFKAGAAEMGKQSGASAQAAVQEFGNGFKVELPKVQAATDAGLKKLTDSLGKHGKDRVDQEKKNAAAELKQWNQYLAELKARRTEAVTDDPRPLMRQQLRERFPRRSKDEIEAAVTRELGIKRIEAAEKAQEAARKQREQKFKQDQADTAREMKDRFERDAKARIDRFRETERANAQAIENRFTLEQERAAAQRDLEKRNREEMTAGARQLVIDMREQARALQETWKPLTEGLARVFYDTFSNIQGGFRGMVQSITRGFKQMLVQLAAEYLSSQLANLVFKLIGNATGIGIPKLGSTLGNLAFGAVGAGGGGGGGGVGGATVMPYERYQAGINMLGELMGASGPKPAPAGTGGVTVQVAVRGEQVSALRRDASQAGASIGREILRQAKRNG